MATTKRTLEARDDGEIELTETPQDSVEISVNAKGEPSWSIKAYGRDEPDIAPRLAALRALAEQHASAIRSPKGA